MYYCGDVVVFFGLVGVSEVVDFFDVLDVLCNEYCGYDWFVDKIEEFILMFD